MIEPKPYANRSERRRMHKRFRKHFNPNESWNNFNTGFIKKQPFINKVKRLKREEEKLKLYGN